MIFFTENKSFRFQYTLTLHKKNERNILRIEIVPFGGEIKPSCYLPNRCTNILVTFYNNKTYELYNDFSEETESRFIEINDHHFKVVFSVFVPDECFEEENATLTISTRWILGAKPIKECLEMEHLFA